jgi:hypothetical protein
VIESSGDQELRRYAAAWFVVTKVEGVSLLEANIIGAKVRDITVIIVTSTSVTG